MVEYLYRKNKDFKKMSDIKNWVLLDLYNFRVFTAYRIDGIRFDSATDEFIEEINKLKVWEILNG